MFGLAAAVPAAVLILAAILLRGSGPPLSAPPPPQLAPAAPPPTARASPGLPPGAAPAPAEESLRGQGGSLGEDFFAELRRQSEERRALAARGPAAARQVFDALVSDAAARVLGPGWSVSGCRDDTGAPVGLKAEHLGRSDVLVTHPLDERNPCVLEKTVSLPVGTSSTLAVTVATIDRASEEDWILRVRADEALVATEVVGRRDGRAAWQVFRFDLSPFAGRTVKLRLENASGGPAHHWAWEHGVWAEARAEIR